MTLNRLLFPPYCENQVKAVGPCRLFPSYSVTSIQFLLTTFHLSRSREKLLTGGDLKKAKHMQVTRGNTNRKLRTVKDISLLTDSTFYTNVICVCLVRIISW